MNHKLRKFYPTNVEVSCSLINSWQEWLARYLIPSVDDRKDPELKRYVLLLYGISFIGTVALLFFSYIAFTTGYNLFAALDLALSIILLLNLYDLRRRKKYSFNIKVGLFFTACVFAYLYMTGGVNQTAFLWYFTFPLVACCLMGARNGALVSCLMVVPVLLMMWFDFQHPFFATYSISFEIRFLVAYLVVSIFSFLFQNNAENNRQEIMLVNDKLESLVAERTNELVKANRALTAEIEKHQRAEERLKESEKNYRLMFEKSGNAMFLVDLKSGTYLDANPAAEELTGRPIATLKQLTTADIAPDTAGSCLAQLAEHNAPITMRAVNYLRPDGSIRETLLNAVSLNDSIALCIAHDITELKKVEREREEITTHLQQSQRMESLGTLAGGIAHDFNNILSAIVGFTELSTLKISHEHPIQNHLAMIHTSAERAQALVGQILTFSRKKKVESKPIQVKLVTREALKLIRASIPATIDITQSLNCELQIKGDPVQLHQLIMNLCTNAAHAIGDKGGEISVSLTENIRSNMPVKAQTKVQDEQMIVLTVSDTGCGMPQEVIDRIFDPFFTTKKTGEGTGMGLSVVHGIIQNLHAEIFTHSIVGKGTSFEVWIPTISNNIVSKIMDGGELPTGTENIFLIDDELWLLEIGKEMLQSLGYCVSGFTDSVDAFQTLRKKICDVDLIISDNTMPQMTGLELAQKVKKINPDVPLILCTGYLSDADHVIANNTNINAIIEKPLFLNKLAHTIRNVLDKREGNI